MIQERVISNDAALILELKTEIIKNESLIQIASDSIANLKETLSSNQSHKLEIDLLKQQAMGLQEVVTKIPYIMPKDSPEAGTLPISVAIVQTNAQVDGLVQVLDHLAQSQKELQADLGFQRVLNSELIRLLGLLEDKVSREFTGNGTSDVISESDGLRILEKSLAELEGQTSRENQRERNLMKRLKNLLGIISETNFANNNKGKGEGEEGQFAQKVKDTNQINLKIVQDLLNGMMTNENEGYIETPVANGESGIAHPLIRQLLKADIITEKENLKYVRLRKYGLD